MWVMDGVAVGVYHLAALACEVHEHCLLVERNSLRILLRQGPFEGVACGIDRVVLSGAGSFRG